MTSARPTPSDAAALLAERLPELLRAIIGTEPTSRSGTEWRFRTRGSLAVVVGGPKRGSWHDHEAGEGGDALALVAHLQRTTMRTAYHWATAWLSLPGATPLPPPPDRPPAPPLRPREASTAWHAIWEAAVLATGTPVEVYLASRGLALEAEAPLRFHAACPRGAQRCPAMVALMSEPDTGKPCGIHRTYLTPDGRGKAPDASGNAKMMLGAAGIVRLVPDEDVTSGLGLAEGIETALAVMQGFAWRPLWAAGSAGGIARFPVLPGIECLTIFADPDGAGERAARDCAIRWRAAGREVRVIAAPADTDFNDLVQRRVSS